MHTLECVGFLCFFGVGRVDMLSARMNIKTIFESTMYKHTSMNVVVVIVGQVRTFAKRKQELTSFIEKLERQGHTVKIVVSTSENHINPQLWPPSIHGKIAKIVYLRDSKREYTWALHKIQANLKTHRMQTLEEHPTSIPFVEQKDPCKWYSQWFQLTKGLECIPKLESELGFVFDIVIKTRFDYVYPEDFNLDIFSSLGFGHPKVSKNLVVSTDANKSSFANVLTAGLSSQHALYAKALEHFGLKSIHEHLSFLSSKLKINPNAGRICNEHMVNLNLGGHYFLNHPNLVALAQEIDKHGLSCLDNVIYCFNDWFIYGTRQAMLVLRGLSLNYFSYPAQSSDINFYFTPEYQLLLFATHNGLCPIMFHNTCSGGIDRDNQPFVLNDRKVVKGVEYIRNGLALVHTLSGYVRVRKDTESPRQFVSLLCNYVNFGDTIEFCIDADKQCVLVVGDECVQVNPSNSRLHRSYKVVSRICGKMYIHLDVSGLCIGESVLIKQFEFHIIQPTLTALTFYTQGPDVDNVPSLDLSKAHALFKESIEMYVDEYKSYTYNQVRRMHPAMVKNFNIDCLANAGAGFTGFYRWKPYIILKALEGMTNGDIVFYRDCNVAKYPNYLVGSRCIRESVGFVLQQNQIDIYVPIEKHDFKMRHYIKKEVFDAFNIDIEKHKDDLLLNASMMVVRKSAYSVSFITKWLNMCMVDDLIDSIARIPQDIEFRHNTYDQALLNMLVIIEKENGHLPHAFPIFTNPSRVFDWRLLQTLTPRNGSEYEHIGHKPKHAFDMMSNFMSKARILRKSWI